MPPPWTLDELEKDRQLAIQAFRDQRMREPLEDYLDFFEEAQTAVEELLEASGDFTRLSDMAVEVLRRADFREVLRYLSGPPVSEDDLEVLAQFASLTARAAERDPAGSERVVQTVLLGLDRRRFPWLSEGLDPTERDRAVASVATAALIASSRVGTKRRMASKDLQEAAVREVLFKVGMVEGRRKHVRTWDDAPPRGQFVRGDVTVGSRRRADVVVRLWNGKLMPIECKVSNSALNSIKRLNNDTAAKAIDWKNEMGHGNTIPVALLAGVFALPGLVSAQEKGLLIFWSHNLESLVEYIESTRPT